VGWYFTQHAIPEIVRSRDFPRLSEFSARAEALPAFVETAY
jgi:hypothetical protein